MATSSCLFSATIYNQSQLAERKHVARYWLINTVATVIPLSAHPSLLVITTKLAAAILGVPLFGGGALPAQYYPVLTASGLEPTSSPVPYGLLLYAELTVSSSAAVVTIVGTHRRTARLSWPGWLHKYQHGMNATGTSKRSPIPVLTGPDAVKASPHLPDRGCQIDP